MLNQINTLDVRLLDSLRRLIEDIEKPARQASERSKTLDHKRCWHYIPSEIEPFIAAVCLCVDILESERPKEDYTFLDVGCGAGSKPFLAATVFGLEATGLEIDPLMCRAAGHLYLQHHTNRFKVVQGDAMKFSHYGDFDIIHYYAPLKGEHCDMRDKIDREAKQGAFIMSTNYVKRKGCEQAWSPYSLNYLKNLTSEGLLASMSESKRQKTSA